MTLATVGGAGRVRAAGARGGGSEEPTGPPTGAQGCAATGKLHHRPGPAAAPWVSGVNFSFVALA